MSIGLVEQPSSGSQTGVGRYEFVFKCRRGEGEGYFNDFVGDATSGSQFRGLYIDADSSRMSAGESWDTIFIVATKTPKAVTYTDIDRPNGDTVYSANMTYMERGVEMLPNYRTHWNYDLFVAVEATEESIKNPPAHFYKSPAWWLTAKDTNIPYEDQFNYKWGQSTPPDQTVKSGGVNKVYRWLLQIQRTKPGKEVRPAEYPTVVERIYFRTKSKAEAALRKANTLSAPKRTYIWGKNDKNWLCQPQGIEEDGYYFIVVTNYIYADEWDEDFYK